MLTFHCPKCECLDQRMIVEEGEDGHKHVLWSCNRCSWKGNRRKMFWNGVSEDDPNASTVFPWDLAKNFWKSQKDKQVPWEAPDPSTGSYCPVCGELLTQLAASTSGKLFCTLSRDSVYEMTSAEVDSGEKLFSCPECGEELFQDEDSAITFLNRQ